MRHILLLLIAMLTASLAPAAAPRTAHAASTITADARILAAPRATKGQAQRSLVPRYNRAYSDLDVRWIVTLYFAEAPLVGVDPLVAVAQMSHETGSLSSWWAQRPRRNMAGIGVNGMPGAGCTFPSLRAAVRAHVGRLLAYALPKGQGTAAQRALIAEALKWRALPDSYRGSARTIRGLTGRWATDPYYHGKVVRHANAILATR